MLRPKTWSEEIAEVTGRPEYQTVTILIEDRSNVEITTDFATGEQVTTGEPVTIYSGRARVIGITRGATIEGTDMANATTIKSIRFQAPRQAFGHVAPGQHVRVVSAPENPTLELFVYKVNSDVQGGSAATRTIEAGIDIEGRW